jgi:hypothetical protein
MCSAKATQIAWSPHIERGPRRASTAARWSKFPQVREQNIPASQVGGRVGACMDDGGGITVIRFLVTELSEE